MNLHFSLRTVYRLAGLLAIWVTAPAGFAQTNKPDVIVKIDNTRISCRVISVDASVIRYRRLNSPTPLSISKSLVNKIIYASGKVVVITKPVEKVDPKENTKPDPIAKPKVPPPPPLYLIQLRNGQRIRASSVALSADKTTISYQVNPQTAVTRTPVSAVDFVEKPDGTFLPLPPSSSPPPPLPPPTYAKKFTIQVNALPVYMLGNPVWTSLSDGYGHTIGVGGATQFDYWLNKKISVGAELGYLAWNTQVDLVENKGETPYLAYTTKTTQLVGLAHVRFLLGDHFYLMPQGGISLLRVKLAVEGDSDGFSGTQTCYGGAVGYLFNLGRTVNLDAGLFYRSATGSQTLKDDYGVTPMSYVGVRLGLGVSH